MSKGAVVFAGLLAATTVASAQQETTAVQQQRDPRLVKLKQFLEDHRCPVANLADEFLRAADEHQLDWRLLPTIALVESGGGRAYRHNNIMGWRCSRQKFDSIADGIHHVASKLATSPMYRNKDTRGKLLTYNVRKAYCLRVMALMESIGPRDFEVAAVN